MLHYFLSIILFLIFFSSATAQDISYSQKIIKVLSANNMYGRGYVNKGDKITAKYIQNELKKHNTISFNQSYFQKLSFPINTFPSNMHVAINGKTLNAAEHFVVSPDCPSISGDYPLIFLSQAADTNQLIFDSISSLDYSGKFIVSPFIKRKINIENTFNAAGIIIPKSSISWWASTGYKEAQIPTIHILDSLLSDSINNISLNIKNKFHNNYESQNVVAYIPGNFQPDSFVVFTAHYDHLGLMGEGNIFAGANDNASGVAMLLALAKHYSITENKPSYSTIFIFFTGEEAGLIGSRYFVQNPLFPIENIKALINIDMVGSGSEGIGLVNGKENPKITNKLQRINTENNYFPDILVREASCNSDHCFFHKAGVPAVFIYTHGKEHKEYHNLKDTPENLPLTKFTELFKLLVEFAN